MSSGNQRYINTAGTHDITMNDDFINVSTSVGAITLVFPNIRDSGAIPTNKVWFVNDVDDMAATNNVTIVASTTTPATELNGGSSVILSVSGFSAEVTPSGYYNYMVNSGTSEGGISGNGTLNYLAKFTPSGTILGNSLLYDSGVGVTIGSTSILSKFTVLTNVNDIIGLSGQLITNINAGAGAAAILFFRNNDNKGFEIGTVSSTHTTYQDAYGRNSDSFYTTVVGGGDMIFKQRASGKGIKFFNAGNGVVSGQSLVNMSDNGTGFYTDSISAVVHIKGVDSTSGAYALKVDNSASSPILYARNDKSVFIDNLSGVGTRLIAADPSGKLSVSQVTDDGTSVGIGISSGIKFNVLGNTNGDWEGGRFYSNNAAQYCSVGWGGMTSTYYLKFQSGAGQSLSLNASGENVGIGTLSPTAKLQVVGLSTYVDNAAAVTAGLTAGAFYIRTGHGLDVVV